jgi:hypothetical protein
MLLSELYALYMRKGDLSAEDKSSVFTQDLYRYYLRSGVEVLSKYFEKVDKYKYMYFDVPLFVPGETLVRAEERINSISSRERQRFKARRSPVPKRQ